MSFDATLEEVIIVFVFFVFFVQLLQAVLVMGQASFLFKIRLLVFTYSIDLQIVLPTYKPLNV